MSADGYGYRWSRASVGGAWTHVVRRRDLDALLVDRPIDALHRVSLAGNIGYGGDAASFFRATLTKQPKGLDPDDFAPLATASWHGIKSAYFPPLAASVRVYPVRKTEATEVRALLLEHVLPDLLSWIHAIDRGPETGRTELRRTAVVRSRGVAVRRPD